MTIVDDVYRVCYPLKANTIAERELALTKGEVQEDKKFIWHVLTYQGAQYRCQPLRLLDGSVLLQILAHQPKTLKERWAEKIAGRVPEWQAYLDKDSVQRIEVEWL